MDKKGSIAIVILFAALGAILAGGIVGYYANHISSLRLVTNPTACTITSFVANSQSVPRGGNITFSWSTKNCTGARLTTDEGKNLISDQINGSIQTLPIYHNTVFTLWAFIPEVCPSWGCSDYSTKNDSKQITITATPNPGSQNPINPNPHNVSINGKLYLISSDGSKYPYLSVATFNSYGFNSSSTIVAPTQDEINAPVRTDSNSKVQYVPPRVGSLIKFQNEIYTIVDLGAEGILKVKIPSMTVFNNLGYSLSNVFLDDISSLPSMDSSRFVTNTHYPGDVIKSNGQMYLMEGGMVLHPIANADILHSWGYGEKDVVPATKEDLLIPGTTDRLPIGNPLDIKPETAIPPFNFDNSLIRS